MPWSSWAREPQLLSLRVWSLCSATREAAIVRGPRTAMKSGPHLPQLEKALAQKWRPNTAINKNKLINLKKKNKNKKKLVFNVRVKRSLSESWAPQWLLTKHKNRCFTKLLWFLSASNYVVVRLLSRIPDISQMWTLQGRVKSTNGERDIFSLRSTTLDWTLGCMCLFELWFSLGICPGVGLLLGGSYGSSIFVF